MFVRAIRSLPGSIFLSYILILIPNLAKLAIERYRERNIDRVRAHLISERERERQRARETDRKGERERERMWKLR